MDTPLVSLPLDSRALQQSIDQTILSQMMLYQFSEQGSYQGSVVPSIPSNPCSCELGGRLSFELVKYACGLTQSSSIPRISVNTVKDVTRYAGVTSSFAPPILPMHQRDRTILDDLFEREDMPDIHTDITAQLGKLVTEPCWDDDPYNFLSGYL